MATKKQIIIDRDKCIGCEKCVNACPGGALAMVEGKAAVVREDYCDGLGACIGECPVDAIHFEQVKADSPKAKPAAAAKAAAKDSGGFVCPSMANKLLKKAGTAAAPTDAQPAAGAAADIPSALEAWPIQLHLIQPHAPQFAGADLLIAASCTAFTMGNFHNELLRGRALVIACPKLDNTAGYVEKLADLFSDANLASVTVARMQVPCCMGLTNIVHMAKELAKSDMHTREIVIGLNGQIINDNAPNETIKQ